MVADYKFSDIKLNRVELATPGSSGSLIGNLIADFGNSSKFTIRHLGLANFYYLILYSHSATPETPE